MKILIKDIKLSGLEAVGEVSLEDLGLSSKEESKFIAPLKVQVKAERISDSIIVKTRATGLLETSCARCLELVQKPWNKDMVLDFPLAENPKSIEIGDEVRQEAVLSLPQRLLCREDCEGICVGCGVNLNQQKCRCKVKEKMLVRNK